MENGGNFCRLFVVVNVDLLNLFCFQAIGVIRSHWKEEKTMYEVISFEGNQTLIQWNVTEISGVLLFMIGAKLASLSQLQ